MSFIAKKRTTRTRSLLSIAFFTFAAVSCGACDSESGLIENPLIDRWCGDRPCEWQVEGQIERVGTWHTNDYAVSFVSNHAELSQVNATVESGSVSCFEFSAIAKIDEGTKLFLELDFLNDGKIDFSQRLPVSDYEPLLFSIDPPTWYKGVRFIIRKDGPGTAILAKLRAQSSDRCTTAIPVPLNDRPTGATCEDDSQCSLMLCNAGTCDGCADDKACGKGQVCGYVVSGLDEIKDCKTKGSSLLGEPCDHDAECNDGACCNGACSTCCTDAACGKAGRCTAVTLSSLASIAPHQCDPGQSQYAKGAVCTSDSDCESQQCNVHDDVCNRAPCSDDFFEDDAGAGADGGVCTNFCIGLAGHRGTCL